MILRYKLILKAYKLKDFKGCKIRIERNIQYFFLLGEIWCFVIEFYEEKIKTI